MGILLDLKFDELDILELQLILEEQFDIDIQEEQESKTVSDVVEFVVKEAW